MFIQTEDTPNPNTLKFLPPQARLVEHTIDIRSPQQAAHIPLAQTLFTVEGITGIFLGHDFISITKAESADWFILRPFILDILLTYFSRQATVEVGVSPASHAAIPPEPVGDSLHQDIIDEIKDLLDTRVRPAVANDGGDIIFDRFEEGIVYLHLQGACSGCPSSTATLKMGIENMLKFYIPEVQEVRAIENE